MILMCWTVLLAVPLIRLRRVVPTGMNCRSSKTSRIRRGPGRRRAVGGRRMREMYDAKDFDGMALTLSQEGVYHVDPDGTGGLWVMRLTQNPPGYSWR